MLFLTMETNGSDVNLIQMRVAGSKFWRLLHPLSPLAHAHQFSAVN